MKEKIVTSRDTGAKGGKAIVRKRGKKWMSELGKKGAAVRWGKKSKAKVKK